MDSRLLDTKQAAGYLSCSKEQVLLLAANGYLSCVNLKSRGYRFKISDLDAYILQRRNPVRQRFIHASDETLPVEIVAKLLGLSEANARMKKYYGLLKDYTHESVRRYIEIHYHVKAEKSFKKKSEQLIKRLRWNIEDLRELVKKLANTSVCEKCGGPVLVIPDRVKRVTISMKRIVCEQG